MRTPATLMRSITDASTCHRQGPRAAGPHSNQHGVARFARADSPPHPPTPSLPFPSPLSLATALTLTLPMSVPLSLSLSGTGGVDGSWGGGGGGAGPDPPRQDVLDVDGGYPALPVRQDAVHHPLHPAPPPPPAPAQPPRCQPARAAAPLGGAGREQRRLSAAGCAPCSGRPPQPARRRGETTESRRARANVETGIGENDGRGVGTGMQVLTGAE